MSCDHPRDLPPSPVDESFSDSATGWFLVGNEGMRALYIPFKGLYRALVPSFPTKNQGEGPPPPTILTVVKGLIT